MKLGAKAGTASTVFGWTRGHSYAMNCVLCHEADSSRYAAPTRSLLFAEADLALSDNDGLVGPVNWMSGTNVISMRHNERGHLLFCDFHTERVNSATAKKLTRSKRFWLPTTSADSLTMSFVAGLPDP